MIAPFLILRGVLNKIQEPRNPRLGFISNFSDFSFSQRRTNRTESTVSPASERPSTSRVGVDFVQLAFGLVSLFQRIVESINCLACRRPYRAQEICDLDYLGWPFRACCQDMLTQQWAHKLPLVQWHSPAMIASAHLDIVLEQVAASDTTLPLAVIDFCAGGGGPTPIFEQIVNNRRRSRDQKPLEFLMSDLYPNIPAWEEQCNESSSLGYIPEPVDATSPPASAQSLECKDVLVEDQERYSESDPPPNTRKDRVFRLFSLSFHHFDDNSARKILQSTMEHSDGIAIIELQDRRIGCLLMMLGNGLVSLLFTFFWFPIFGRRAGNKRLRNLKQLVMTYSLLAPFVMTWDGIASCLRTREFDEVMRLAGETQVPPVTPQIEPVFDGEAMGKQCVIGDWTFLLHRRLHTLPFGYLNMITGVRKPRD